MTRHDHPAFGTARTPERHLYLVQPPERLTVADWRTVIVNGAILLAVVSAPWVVLAVAVWRVAR